MLETNNAKSKNFSVKFASDYLLTLNSKFFDFLEFLSKRERQDFIHNIKSRTSVVYQQCEIFLSEVTEKLGEGSFTRLGDMHNRSKCTVLWENSDKKLIYKPISADLIIFINQILALLNKTGLFDFYLIRVLENSAQYSVIEYINNQPCANWNKFNYHYGALIAIITFLRGIDFHRENIFCVDSTPVIVDCESLFYPIIANTKSYDVEATGMIPTDNNNYSLFSQMALAKNIIIEGVSAAFDAFSKFKNDLERLVCENFHKKTRMILKPTRFYHQLLKNCFYAEFMLDLEKNVHYLEACLLGDHPISKAIIKSEIEDLISFDIPYFTYMNGKLFDSKTCEIPQSFCSDSLDDILKSIQNFNKIKSEILARIISI